MEPRNRNSRHKPLLVFAGSMLLLFTVLATPSIGHHFKGLPHFNYFENYPQVPQDEFLGQEGDFEFSLVIYDFQGINKEEALMPDDVRFYLVIYNLREDKVYQGPLTLHVLDGNKIVHTERFKHSEEESLYAFQKVLGDQGKYSLSINIEDHKTTGLLPFKLSSQKFHWGVWTAGILISLIVIVAIGSRKARIAMDRRNNAKLNKLGTKHQAQAKTAEA